MIKLYKKQNLDVDLPIRKTLELYNITIVLGLFFMKATNTVCKFF